ncbi:type 1 glutamine amidotransferase [Sphaerisporangium sp. TRM90804]|uniref:type 1 glutamine amidotransferase n=1 Tax=Sphaerisporangium sp. TRM90804 TaxID=3031113 RepID=UPI00244ACF9A|nr:type 1 glutamine amidotransferase [Sphaerisporangium sp. TRM90804]MDH2424622.1 type 1 glutamine amidotransferase [Sphaerisporangium sp. TRM90804]
MDSRILVIEHEAEAGPGFLADWLAAAGALCDVVRPYLGEPVPLPREGAWHGLIVLGGAASAWQDEEYPWQPATRDLLRASVEAGVPTLGICLGAQLLTLACGGRVERGPGLEVGLRPVTLLPAAREDALFGALPPRVRAIQYHQDAMTVLPPGAVPLATGAAYPHQAFRLGDRAWGVQFHPEATPEIFLSWTAPNAEELTAAGHVPAELDAAVLAGRAGLAAAWRPWAEAFARVVAGAREAVRDRDDAAGHRYAPLSIHGDRAITARNH